MMFHVWIHHKGYTHGAVCFHWDTFSSHRPAPVVGVLGCMAERLKTKLLECERLVDLVVGPDAYRSLPSLVQGLQQVCILFWQGWGCCWGMGEEACTMYVFCLLCLYTKHVYCHCVLMYTCTCTQHIVLPRHNLLTQAREDDVKTRHTAINVQLSLEETYADITPLRPAGTHRWGGVFLLMLQAFLLMLHVIRGMLECTTPSPHTASPF